MKVFISHASDDKELVSPLVDLLQLGAGIPHEDIFCSSSVPIPNGKFFVPEILTKLQTADLVVAVLSRSYFRSNFCIAELGVAQVRQILPERATFYSLLVPPVIFSDLGGSLCGVQSGKILEPNTLDELRDRAIKGMAKHPQTSTWNNKRDAFLRAIADKVNHQIANELLELITRQDVYLNRSTDPTINFKSKLCVVLRNETGKDIEAKVPKWKASSGDLLFQSPSLSRLKLEEPSGWEGNNWQADSTSIPVSNGRSFLAWIGWNGLDKVSDLDFRRRCVTERLGTLELPIKIDGHDLTKELRL